METIGLRELNQNPSKAVARVRAGSSIIVTDHGRPVIRMIPEIERPTTLQRMLEANEARPPIEQGMPQLIPDLAPDIDSLSDLLISERNKEHNR